MRAHGSSPPGRKWIAVAPLATTQNYMLVWFCPTRCDQTGSRTHPGSPHIGPVSRSLSHMLCFPERLTDKVSESMRSEALHISRHCCVSECSVFQPGARLLWCRLSSVPRPERSSRSAVVELLKPIIVSTSVSLFIQDCDCMVHINGIQTVYGVPRVDDACNLVTVE